MSLKDREIETPHEALKKFWGFADFRPLQLDIINSVMGGSDTLALLPTGGGKSICFQIPALCLGGTTLVISPLVALMDDQVGNLRKRGISACALHSALSFREMDLALENAANGHYKLLYLSPERLQNELFQARLKRMNINLIAVDEAHCISQWGYDFRPPYLQIAEFRELLPKVPVLALTATATPKVMADIQQKLNFKNGRVFQKSFARENLFYNVLNTENKWQRALLALQKIKGSAIVYMRNRKGTVETARWLKSHGLSADYYHAGLSAAQRKEKQQSWLENKTRIMVCTNAFGMGIDKPDVRLVLHLELPDSLEAYFQEAGRAGRDGHRAYSLIALAPGDAQSLKERHLKSFPDLAFLRRVYQALSNYFQVAVGAGENQTFSYQIHDFLDQYRLPALKTYQSLQILNREGLIEMSEGFYQPSRIKLTTDRTTLYDFQLRHPRLDPLIKTLVRSYGGLNIEYARLDEALLAKRLKTSKKDVMDGLQKLHKHKLVDYIMQADENTLSFLRPREEVKRLRISDEHLKHRYRDLKQRISAVIHYAENNLICRNIQLLQYFGEENAQKCGGCDVCRSESKPELNQERFEEITGQIKQYLKEGAKTFNEMLHLISTEPQGITVLRYLIEEGEITISDGKLHLS